MGFERELVIGFMSIYMYLNEPRKVGFASG